MEYKNGTHIKGEYIKWKTVNGKEHKGFIKEVDSNVIIIDCENCNKECCCEV